MTELEEFVENNTLISSVEDVIQKYCPEPIRTTFSEQQLVNFSGVIAYRQKCERAKSMLDDIQSEVKEFYQTNPPRNRKERRERAKALKQKIQCFNSYCKTNGIEISQKKN